MSPVSVRLGRSILDLETGQAAIWLLLIGVNHYEDSQLPSLRYSAFDCQGLAEALSTATQGFPQKQVTIHHDFALQPPRLETVRSSLKQIADLARPEDTVIFYFSGHGMLDPASQQVVLCLADTNSDRLLNTGLSLSELLQSLDSCQARDRLVCLDACHSGGMTLKGVGEAAIAGVGLSAAKSALGAGSTMQQGSRGQQLVQARDLTTQLNPTHELVQALQQQAVKSKGFYALLSCDEGQQSWEFRELGHGVFTYYLMRGLQGEAADDRGVIDADRLYEYVYYQTLAYIDKTNQQLRLINQQKSSRGEIQLHPEYPLQTPKRIVEGVGKLVVGIRSELDLETAYPRQALILDGFNSTQSVCLSKLLGVSGGFELEYWCPSSKSTTEIDKAIANCWQKVESAWEKSPGSSIAQETATLLVYVRAAIEETPTGEPILVLGEETRLSRSWWRQQLRQLKNAQQIVILDCPDGTSLQDWVEDLQLESEAGQCIIAAASPANAPERFAQAVVNTLAAANTSSGLSVAGWITQLQVEMADTGIPLYIWLSGTQGAIEVWPSKAAKSFKFKTGFDLGICPYKGLKAFREEDAQYFYGRETLTPQLIDLVGKRSLVAVLGASGSGKSSIVQAGLVAQLRQGQQLPNSDKWLIETLRPGSRPLETLSRRLSAKEQRTRETRELRDIHSSPSPHLPISPSPHPPHLILEGMLYQGVEGFVYWLRSRPEPAVVLVIDQFEELFTLASAADREKFLELLLGALEFAKDKFKLVITLRADFIAPCLEIPLIAAALQDSSLLLPPQLTTEDYRRVIVHPAETVGLRVEPELVEVLLQQLERSAGDLPLLEFVLEQLWEHRVNGELTLPSYLQQIGGLKGALERKAQAVYDSLDPEAQACAQWIFLSLTQLGDNTEDTRRRVLKSDLVVPKYPAPLVERTLSALIEAKLVVINWEEGEMERWGDGKMGREGAGEQGSRGAFFTPHSTLNTQHSTLPPVTVEVIHEILIRHWSTLRWWLEQNRTRLQLQRQIEQAASLWKQSDRQSDFLLRGVRLGEAEEIYIKHTDELSDDVQLFIEAGLAERQQQQLQAKRRLKQTQTVAIAMIFLGVAASGLGGLAYLQGQKAQMSEIEALNSLSESLLLSDQQLESLVASLKAARHLRGMGVWNKFFPSQLPVDLQNKTAIALGQAVYETQERNRLEGHTAWVTSVSFSPDGQTLASASSDSTIKLWRPDGTLLKTLQGHTKDVHSVSFSPDGQLIASASSDSTIKLWRPDGTLWKTLTGHKKVVWSVIFSADGQTMASYSSDRTLKLWSRDGTLLKTFSGLTDKGVNTIRFSPDGQTLAIGIHDGTIQLWNRDGVLLKTLRRHQSEVNSVNFSPDGKFLASGGEEGTVKLWNLADGSSKTFTRHERGIHSHRGPVKYVIFSPDGQIIASAGADKLVQIWSTDGSLLKTIEGHTQAVNSLSFSPDGKTLASASDDRTVRLWKLAEILPKTLYGHRFDVVGLSFSPDGNTLASASEDMTIKLWDLDRSSIGDLPRQRRRGRGDGSGGGNGSGGGRENSLRQLPAVANEETNFAENAGVKTLTGHTSWLTKVRFSPDGQTLASASADYTIKLWNRDGKLLQTLKGHSSWVIDIRFSPDGQTLASAGGDRAILLWKRDPKTGLFLERPDRTLKGHDSWVTGVSFSPIPPTPLNKGGEGGILASASADSAIKLWNLKGELLKTIPGQGASVWSVSFSPDGQMLAAANQDNTVKLWSRDGQLLKTLEGHEDQVSSVTFSPDGKTLASVSDDDTIKIWSVDGHLLKTLQGHGGNVRSVAFSPDGKTIASASSDRTIKLWSLPNLELQTMDLDLLLESGCREVRDYLKTNPNLKASDRQICDGE
ncbi:MAG: caspase family protein [Cyanosarcina radialis HA8281-LM2]|jgi:WD40 repeat protein/uncharacterized caspase-like protein|nr:caspase family protein [Cyanosarcina radialis HA8281-LM2]